MNKKHILDEIRRTANENNGIPLGKMKFEKQTGIKESDWRGKYWAKWSEAVKEVGFTPNKLQGAYEKDFLIEQLASLIKEIKKFPSDAEIRLKSHNVDNFPASSTFNRLGTTTERANKIISYCQDKPDYQDVVDICGKYITSFNKENGTPSEETKSEIGWVYLMKHGKYYKIGRTSYVEKRNYELGIKLPEELKVIHKIKTDDPCGIEAYWHKRYEDKRKKGEWFDLSTSDIKAFKRRKFM